MGDGGRGGRVEFGEDVYLVFFLVVNIDELIS